MDQSNQSGGLGLFSVVGIVFIILKLTHVIAWSWWWVLSPFWIGLAIYIVLALILFFGVFLWLESKGR